MIFTDTPAGKQHLLPGVEARIFARMHAAREVDTRHHWEISDNFTFARNGKRILLVKTGPFNVDGYFTFRQTARLEGLY